MLWSFNWLEQVLHGCVVVDEGQAPLVLVKCV